MWKWLLDRWNRLRRRPEQVQAHMTFGQTTFGRTLNQTSVVLRKQLWIWPILAVVLLAAIGYGVSSAIRETMRANLQSELQTLLNVEVSMLEKWLRLQESNAESLANDQQIRNIVHKAVTQQREQAILQNNNTGAPENSLPIINHAELAQELAPGMTSHQFAGYVLIDKTQRIISATHLELIGQDVSQYESILEQALNGQTTISPPFSSIVILKDESGKLRTGTPTMFVCAPVRDNSFQVIGALALRIRPEREFTHIMQLGQLGESGETYAFDKRGVMVSNSRFDEDLILLGLLPDTEYAHSITQLSLRNPGGNMLRGFRPKVRRSELPLTFMCSEAIAGRPGVNVDGYADYRGVPVVGAWQWLPKYELGVATEIDYDEAFRPLSILQWAFYSLYALLGISSVAIFVFTLVVSHWQREAQRAAIEAKQLGQYRLEHRIGAGAMGVVYKGHHAMLRRETAIKMLDVEKVNEAALAKFEREVQITCKLNHPNTIMIYDYGRTPEGVFYYAMEYLDGISLQELVEQYGPQSEARVVQILLQICGSLYEAHSLGLVHRDIKPANIMLNRRGAMPDLVKVLDFGLVKTVTNGKQHQDSHDGTLSGTPLYISPEAIQSPDFVDTRSDLYAVGAVGYFLLTGQPVFNANTLVGLFQMHVNALPDSPSQRLCKNVSAELEHALLACLEKSIAKRPQTARDLAAMLERVPTRFNWSYDEASAWWSRHERSQGRPSNIDNTSTQTAQATTASQTAAKTVVNQTSTSGYDQTICIPKSNE
jgi:serine/threonine protein kinase